MCAIVPDTITCQTLKYDRPGDYPFTDASDIDGFMIWLKNSLLEDTELLSNAVGFLGAWRACGQRVGHQHVQDPRCEHRLSKGRE
ncbi:hypothetical protein [uncultured Tateyamaria sp.]|uniref:hypothetical protein n=1 Tax=uncultured Tateyamaria sp. TaxID=455651 RepID=UPI0026057E5F|nr:hypothetical protein [uncultured Tateyamaria sp.]